jgi:phosphatidylinositol kinase/protein kinase (PI-3  family)
MSNAGDMVLRNSFEKKCQDLYFNEGDLKKAARLFEDLILKNNPPLLYWWFVNKYTDPHQWYQARVLFTLSAAVWSAVGYVIGLGDRHAENILVDTTRGELVHVDFDCIFNKVSLAPAVL